MCSGIYGKITSTGTIPTQGKTIAVDPSVIPYGSIVKIDGIKYIAEDCGGAIKGNKIDIYMDDYDECIDFGRKLKEVKIWKMN